MSPNILKIGTRQSALALWQSRLVKDALEAQGHKCILVPIKSAGDIIKNRPLYAFGMSGVFTKALDSALLSREIDIAVHSLKDVPTILPKSIVQAAVLKRGDPQDVLVPGKNGSGYQNATATIATGSLRRKAQWLHHYPHHNIVGLRGNIATRLKKLNKANWDGAILAAAGLERLGLLTSAHKHLDWMVPAPGQGAIMIAALGANERACSACTGLNDEDTEICTSVEREFLNLLEAGCTAPIGAYASIRDDHIYFQGVLLSYDGRERIDIHRTAPKADAHLIARDCVSEIEDKGGRALITTAMAAIKAEAAVHIVSTKTLSDSQKNLFSDNIDITDYDFLDIRFEDKATDCVQTPTAIFTSQNAVKALLAQYEKTELKLGNIFCVGEATRALIEKEIGPVCYMGRTAKQLAAYISAQTTIKSLRYFCGNLHLDDLPDTLEDHKISVENVQCYETIFTPTSLQIQPDAVLFFSPSGVKSYLQKNDAKGIAFCIGPTTALAAQKYFRRVEHTKHSAIEAMIRQVNSHYA